MKQFFKNIFIYILIAVAVLVPLAILFQDFYGIFLKLGGGSIILGIIVTMFATIGGINMFRGFGAVLEMDGEKYVGKADGWRFYVYLIIHIGGYLALYYAMIKCL